LTINIKKCLLSKIDFIIYYKIWKNLFVFKLFNLIKGTYKEKYLKNNFNRIFKDKYDYINFYVESHKKWFDYMVLYDIKKVNSYYDNFIKTIYGNPLGSFLNNISFPDRIDHSYVVYKICIPNPEFINEMSYSCKSDINMYTIMCKILINNINLTDILLTFLERDSPIRINNKIRKLSLKLLDNMSTVTYVEITNLYKLFLKNFIQCFRNRLNIGIEFIISVFLIIREKCGSDKFKEMIEQSIIILYDDEKLQLFNILNIFNTIS
jgi:hypothetical protein